MVNGPENLGNVTEGHTINLTKKNPYFLCNKILRNGIELCQDWYLSMCTLLNLSPLGNLSHRVFFLVDLFFRCRSPMNITGAVARNPSFHHIKTVLC